MTIFLNFLFSIYTTFIFSRVSNSWSVKNLSNKFNFLHTFLEFSLKSFLIKCLEIQCHLNTFGFFLTKEFNQKILRSTVKFLFSILSQAPDLFSAIFRANFMPKHDHFVIPWLFKDNGISVLKPSWLIDLLFTPSQACDDALPFSHLYLIPSRLLLSLLRQQSSSRYNV